MSDQGDPRAAERERLRRAVALRYDQDRDAVPRVVANATGQAAERVIRLARDHGVEIREDPDLIELLARLEVDQYIPQELFRAVAEVMAYVYRVNNRTDDLKRLTGQGQRPR